MLKDILMRKILKASMILFYILNLSSKICNLHMFEITFPIHEVSVIFKAPLLYNSNFYGRDLQFTIDSLF